MKGQDADSDRYGIFGQPPPEVGSSSGHNKENIPEVRFLMFLLPWATFRFLCCSRRPSSPFGVGSKKHFSVFLGELCLQKTKACVSESLTLFQRRHKRRLCPPPKLRPGPHGAMLEKASAVPAVRLWFLILFFNVFPAVFTSCRPAASLP